MLLRENCMVTLYNPLSVSVLLSHGLLLFVFWRSAFIVPETAVTCTTASLPAIDVIVAKDARTRFNVDREVRTTAVFFSKS